MKPRHQVSRSAVSLIKRFEGFRAKSAQLDDGRWTIGYGHTKTAREGAEIAEADAEALLLYDLINVAHAVNEWTYAPLNQNQFDALVSFAFNIGLENFRRSTTLRRINEGRMLEAALAMELWRRADFEGERIVVDALVRRRSYEKTLFLQPVDEWAPAPSPVLPPKIDYDVAPFTLTSAPAVLKTDLTGRRAVAERTAGAPLRPLEDTGPTASETAAAAVAARLEAILAQEPKPEPVSLAPPLAAPESGLEPAIEAVEPVAATAADEGGDDGAAVLAFPEREVEAPRDIDVVPGVQGVMPEPPKAEEPATPAVEAPVAFEDIRIERPVKVRRPTSLLVWVALLFVGAALIAAGVHFLQAPAPASPADGIDPGQLGWATGISGLLIVGAAVFVLMTRLAGPDSPSRS
ncbi:MAG TPA: glycoside hydrolase family protein [Caulobacteraceae bacterium]|nr:glycoside hydrolase family protein [Caulobacteraceae bacterium]